MAGDARYPVKFGRIRLARTFTTALALLTLTDAAPGGGIEPSPESGLTVTESPRRRPLRLCATRAEGRSGAVRLA
jgi:hypothetical protein